MFSAPTLISRTPAVFGHEIAGVVAEVGPDVSQFRVGDHVVGSLAQSCGSCARCQSGRSFQCQHSESTLRRPTDAPRVSRKGQRLHQGLGPGGSGGRVSIPADQLGHGSEGHAMLSVGGGLYLVGVSKPEVNLDLNIFDAIGGQKRVQGVNFGSTNFKRDIPMYAGLYLQGRMNLDDLVSRKIALRDVNDGYAALKDGSLNRVVVTSF